MTRGWQEDGYGILTPASSQMGIPQGSCEELLSAEQPASLPLPLCFPGTVVRDQGYPPSRGHQRSLHSTLAGTLAHGLSAGTLAPELSLPCCASWVGGGGTGRTTPAPRSGSRPLPPARIPSPRDPPGPAERQGVGWNAVFPCRALPSLSSAGYM